MVLLAQKYISAFEAIKLIFKIVPVHLFPVHDVYNKSNGMLSFTHSPQFVNCRWLQTSYCHAVSTCFLLCPRP